MINFEGCEKLYHDAQAELDQLPDRKAFKQTRIAIELLFYLMKHLKQLTTRELARVLALSLDIDQWGDVDPFWIRGVAETDRADSDDDHAEQIEALRVVFQRVVDHFHGDTLKPKGNE